MFRKSLSRVYVTVEVSSLSGEKINIYGRSLLYALTSLSESPVISELFTSLRKSVPISRIIDECEVLFLLDEWIDITVVTHITVETTAAVDIITVPLETMFPSLSSDVPVDGLNAEELSGI